jgi:hypothetical protein
MIGTVTAVVMASRGARARSLIRGPMTMTTSVISGKMVAHVTSAIL